MSNLRTTLSQGHRLNKSRLRTLLETQCRQSRVAFSKFTQSHLYEQTRCHTIASDQEQTLKDTLYHRNITHFRDSFRPLDSHILPFLASLRTLKRRNKQQSLKPTTVAPFEAERPTANQKTKKSTNDMRANPFRLSKANYRWHNKSGKGVRNACQFECGLRLWKDTPNPEESSFNNTIVPKRLQTIEPHRYQQKELICERQKRIFTLETK